MLFRLFLLCICLAGCAPKAISFADYATKVRASLTATKAFLASPKDSKLMDAARQECTATVDAVAGGEHEKLESCKSLKMLKGLLDLSASTVSSGGDLSAVPNTSRSSPLDTLFSLTSMISMQLDTEEKRLGTPKATASP